MSGRSFSIPRLNLVLTHGIPPAFCDGVHRYHQPPSGQYSWSELSEENGSTKRHGGRIAYRWRSLLRVRRHMTSSPQGSSSNGSCLCFRHHHGPIFVPLSSHPLLVVPVHAAAELGRNLISKHQIQPEYGDEQADARRDCRNRLARPNSQARTRTGEYEFSLFS